MVKILSIMIIYLPAILIAAISVDINSGNPASPFPQFQPYTNPTDMLDNLANHNPAGVPHAEMEKSIREAYQIMMNRASKPGGGIGGIDYITFKSTPQCSEGDGYALLAAVAMADKTTFDGLWLWIHENMLNKVALYSSCKESDPYNYSALPGWLGREGNSAADADFDIALALLCAYKQWGEFMGIEDKCGNPISYKKAAIDFITALTDTFSFAPSADKRLLSGDIGLDGYFKGGDAWAELSGWSTEVNLLQIGINKISEQPGPTGQYFDYAAPSYFCQFAQFLSEVDSSKYAWNINQFHRAEASSDWLMGKLAGMDPKNLPICGNVQVKDTTPTFISTGNMGEDFRLGWRTILSRVWNGNPPTTWDPASHQVRAGGNSYEETMGKRFARFIWDARQEPWGNGCISVPGTDKKTYWGPLSLISNQDMTGSKTESFYLLNWLHGAGSPSAVVSQDFTLMAEMYRQCEIEWDVETPGDGYLTAVPMYFNGWFRLLGMLVLSGNYTCPSRISSAANMKLYCDVNKTCATAGEEVTYTLEYRNYGSLDAQGVSIIDTVPAGMLFISGSNGCSYNASNRTITWNIGTVPGFKTVSGIAPTMGTVSFTVSISGALNKQCTNRATIRCNNGSGWEINEYPNAVTATMKRNLVDIVEKPAASDNGEKVLPVLHGGRPGIRFSCIDIKAGSNTTKTYQVRLFHDAQEAYIDYNNYRISFFINDSITNCLANTKDCSPGWNLTNMIIEGMKKENFTILHEKLVPGENSRGKWNQRLIIQFSNPADTLQKENLATTTTHLTMYRGITGRIHRGGVDPLRIQFQFYRSDWIASDWSDDWSWNAAAFITDEKHPGFPITPDFTDPAPNNPGVPVNSLHPKVCSTTDTTVDNILIEEWDGYIWRKVFGNAPQLLVATEKLLHNHKVPAPIFGAITKNTVSISLPKAGNIELQVIDIQGRTVTTLFSGTAQAGVNIISCNNYCCSSGMKLLRLQTERAAYIQKGLFFQK